MPRGRRTTTKKKGKQVRDMGTSQSYSANDQDQSESWSPPSARKSLIPDSTVIRARRASLRLANKFVETRTTPVQAYQVPECPVVELDSPPRQDVHPHPSTFALEIRHEETEKVGDSVAPENFSVDVAEMEGVSEAENPMVNHSTEMEGHNAFEAQCISLEPEPMAEGIQVSCNSKERADNNNSKSISMAGHPSSCFSLNLTEMVNMWDNFGDEVNSVGQSSPMDTVEGYQVKQLDFIPIVRKILSKHGDVFKNSVVLTMNFRSMFLEMICEIISKLQDKGLHEITEDELHDMVAFANEMKSKKVNIEWLHLRLEEILEARQILKQSSTLKEEKDSNKKVIESVKKELECCEAEKKAVKEKLQSFHSLLDRICDQETTCKETLARAQNDSARISQIIRSAKSKMRRFVDCSLADGLL